MYAGVCVPLKHIFSWLTVPMCYRSPTWLLSPAPAETDRRHHAGLEQLCDPLSDGGMSWMFRGGWYVHDAW